MAISEIEEESIFQVDKTHYLAQIQQLIDAFIPQYAKIQKKITYLHVFFGLLFSAQIITLAYFLHVYSQSSYTAIGIASLFFTAFSYFILRIYFSSKRPEQVLDLIDRYAEASRKVLGFQSGIPEQHMALAQGFCKLAANLNSFEYNQFIFPSWLALLNPTLEKLSCWCFWHEVHKTKEILLMLSIDEHIKMVKCEPTSPDLHTALANAYIMLSGLFIDPRKIEGYDDERWLPKERYNEEMEKKFRHAAERAIEEFKILSEYAPNDPWIHAQLAYSYHDLQMPQEEIREYETILKLRPDDKDTLFKLGVLYFQQGMNAKGLWVYDELKHYNYKKAEQLIQYYGAYSGQI